MESEEAENISNWRERVNKEQRCEEAEKSRTGKKESTSSNSGKRPKKILSWREMSPGVYKYHGIEYRGENDYGRPISVITLETKEGLKMYYTPSSLYWNLKNRRSETSFIKYQGTQTSEKGYEYPVFKFAK